jgi:hypothetical protein
VLSRDEDAEPAGGGDRGLSVEAFKEAVRGGRTVVTNGPWLAIEVNGRGPAPCST